MAFVARGTAAITCQLGRRSPRVPPTGSLGEREQRVAVSLSLFHRNYAGKRGTVGTNNERSSSGVLSKWLRPVTWLARVCFPVGVLRSRNAYGAVLRRSLDVHQSFFSFYFLVLTIRDGGTPAVLCRGTRTSVAEVFLPRYSPGQGESAFSEWGSCTKEKVQRRRWLVQ